MSWISDQITYLKRPPDGPACWPASPGCHRTTHSWSGSPGSERLQVENRSYNHFICPALNTADKRLCYSSTQELIKQIDYFLPGFSSFLSSKLRKVRSSVVHVQPVDAFQNNGDHSLRKRQKERPLFALMFTLLHYFSLRLRNKE